MNISLNRFRALGITETSDDLLNSAVVASPGDLVRDLTLGLTVMLLFSISLYVSISGLVIAFLALVL